MGRFERRPQNPRENPREKGNPFGEAETAIKAVTEELQIIQRNLLKSFQEDVKRLQIDKLRLADDIQRLQQEKENLQQDREVGELQPLVRQLAQVMANHITSQLQFSVEKLINQANERATSDQLANGNVINGMNEDTRQLIGSLDDTITITFNTLQQELNNYYSSFSQQLSRMSVEQRQGEVILAQLVSRLRVELERTTTEALITTLQDPLQQFIPTEQEASTENAPFSWNQHNEETVSPPSPATKIQNTRTIVPSETTENTETTPNIAPSSSLGLPTPLPLEEPLSRNTAMLPSALVGVILILFSTVTSSLYNVAIKVIFHQGGEILGAFTLQQLLPPTLGNCLLILMLRMLVVIPLMSLLAPMLHPRVWQDINSLFDAVRGNPTPERARAKQLLGLCIASGCFLFLSQVLIYLAIGHVVTGMAIALLFIYPIISGLLSWLLFRDRPSSFGLGAIGFIGMGELLVIAGAASLGEGNISFGSTLAVFSAIAFALYVILTRICAAKLHPVSFTLINFATMLVLCFVGLILPLPKTWSMQVYPPNILELILSAFVLGVLTICGYLLNNFGVRKLGATRSAIIGASVPVLTGIFAGLVIQETLQPVQVLGILLITFGAAAFSFEKMRKIRINN